MSKIREQLGAAGLVVAIVALVAALAGSAIAATGGGNSATASAKGKQGPRGKTGKTGKTGPAGPAGPAGAAGTNGTNGTNGKDGAAGPAGKSVVIGNTAPGCVEGGKSVEVEGSPASKKEICNGEEGPPGEPWTAGGTLPSGKTETGTWTAGVLNNETVKPVALVPISFSIPLAVAIQGEHLHYIAKNEKEIKFNSTTFETEEVTSTACLGTAAAPKAAAGNLCVYTGSLSNAEVSNISFLDLSGNIHLNESEVLSYTAGATLSLQGTGAGEAIKGIGTWAVTAP